VLERSTFLIENKKIMKVGFELGAKITNNYLKTRKTTVCRKYKLSYTIKNLKIIVKCNIINVKIHIAKSREMS